MFKRFKHKAIQKRIASLQQQSRLDNFEPVSKALLITNLSQQEQTQLVQQLKSQLNLADKQLSVLEFVEVKSKKQAMEPWQICKYDFSIKGKFKRNPRPQVLDINYQLLLGYYDSNIFLDSILADYPKAFKVGGLKADSKLLDLRIKNTKNKPELFASETARYLKILNLI